MRTLANLSFLLGCGTCMVLAARVLPPDAAQPGTGSERLSVWFDAVGPWFLVAFVLTCFGALTLRKLANQPQAAGLDGHDDVERMLANMSQRLDELGDDTATWTHSLSELLDDEIPKLLEQRDRLIAQRGLGWFAEAIGTFARFERNVARAWSALVDGAPEEARSSLARARQALEQTRAQFS